MVFYFLLLFKYINNLAKKLVTDQSKTSLDCNWSKLAKRPQKTCLRQGAPTGRSRGIPLPQPCSVIINLNQAGRWEHSRIESQKTRLQCHIWKIKVVKFIQSPWWIFFVGDPCLIDRAETDDMARFREWLSTCSLIIPTSLSSPESTIKEWGRYDERTQCWAGYSWKTCTKTGNLNVNGTSIRLSRQGSPTKKTHHGLLNKFYYFIIHIWHCNLVFCNSMRLCYKSYL